MPARFLAASARRGPVLLALAILAGLAVPPFAHALRGALLPTVFGMMTLVLLRVDIAAALAHLRRPMLLVALVGFQLLASPLLAHGLVRGLAVEPGIAAGVVLFAACSPALSSPAFARLGGLDPELTLLVTLAATLLVPLTAPPLAARLAGIDLAIGIGAFMARLGVMVGAPLALSLVARVALGPVRLAAFGSAIDGAMVWLLAAFGVGVMDGMTARLLADPVWVAAATLAAVLANLGANLLTTALFAPIGLRFSAAAGIAAGNRNMALYLAVLPAGADRRLVLFCALCQLPLYLSPFLLSPLHRRLVARRGAV